MIFIAFLAVLSELCSHIPRYLIWDWLLIVFTFSSKTLFIFLGLQIQRLNSCLLWVLIECFSPSTDIFSYLSSLLLYLWLFCHRPTLVWLPGYSPLLFRILQVFKEALFVVGNHAIYLGYIKMHLSLKIIVYLTPNTSFRENLKVKPINIE